MAFIHYYGQIRRAAPAETDLQRYFRVSAPPVHEMLKTTPGVARSIRLIMNGVSPLRFDKKNGILLSK